MSDGVLKERVRVYNLEGDYNCAESLLRASNDEYNLGLTEESLKVAGGFGGGCYSGRLCGACAGSIMAISKKYIHERAHIDVKAQERVNEYVEAFIEVLGSDLCTELKEKYFDETLEKGRCMRTMGMAADILEKKMQKYELEDA